jgi:PhnB protein
MNPHLAFKGECEEAFRFYEECLGGKIIMMMTYGASPLGEQATPGLRAKILHATFALGDQVLTGADVSPEDYSQPQGFFVLLSVDSAAEAERIFAALAEQGTIKTPLQETFWAVRFGMVVDRFGTPWMINAHAPE